MSALAQLPPVFEPPQIDWFPLVPQIILFGAGLLVILLSSLLPAAGRRLPDWAATTITIAAGVASFVVALVLWYDVRDDGPRSVVADAFGVDGFTLLFTMLVSATVVLTAMLGHSYVVRNHIALPEFSALLLSSATGAVVMASANDLVVLFLGLETLSIGLYVMAAMHLLRSRAQEAAMKYFVLGAFSSAFFLYGVALVYGATGSTNLGRIRQFLATNTLAEQYVLLTGMALLLVGLAFKVAAVPFHMWAPDVYQGSPSPVSGYMAAAAKAAGFAAMLRVFYVAFQTYAVDWTPLVGVLAAVTLVVGSLLAIVQTNVKRMLAYSSISHAGYVLVAVQAASPEGTKAALFYLVTYAVTVIGSFGIVMLAGGLGENSQMLSSYRGLAQRRPVLALAFTFLLLSQAGVPLTSGFVAKFVVIQSAVEVEDYALAVLAMLTSVISAFMYLRIVITMYVGESDDDAPAVRVPWPAGATLVAVVGFTLLVGIVPQFLLDFAGDSVPVLPLVI